MATYGYCEKKGKHEVYTKEEVEQAIANAVASFNLGTISSHNYSRGTGVPSGGVDGDIYDQYFE